MSLEHAFRYGSESSHFHRGYNDGIGLEAQQFANNFQNDNNCGINLNQLLAGVPDHQVTQYHQLQRVHANTSQDVYSHQNKEQHHSSLHSMLEYSNTYVSPSHRQFSTASQSAVAPNSSYCSPAFSHIREQQPKAHPSPSASRSLFSSFNSSAGSGVQYDSNYSSSQLGLEDIFQRLDGLSQNLPSSTSLMSQQPSAMNNPSSQTQSSRLSSSRGSTPLSWNPLGPLSATPLSSLTPSPTLLPAPAPQNPVRPLMEQKLEEDFLLYAEEEAKQQVNAKAVPIQEKMQSTIRGIVKMQVSSKPPQDNVGRTSWSQIVRSSSTSRLPHSSPPQLTRPSPPASPAVNQEQQTPSPCPPATSTTTNNSLPDYHRGPKVDPRWPVQQQVFLGPIPMSISWDEIRNVFYTKVSRKELLHFYVQSKPVNDVVYGQVVFDKVSLANKILKEGPIKVRGQYITMTSMGEKMKQMKTEKKK